MRLTASPYCAHEMVCHRPEALKTSAPFSGGVAWFQALIAVAAFIALWRYKQDVMRVIAACAVLGLIHTLV